MTDFGTSTRRRGHQSQLFNTGLVRARTPALKPLTPKFKGGQAPLLAVEGTVDRQRVLASTQGLPLV